MLDTDWLTLSCPACRTKFRIKAAYAYLPGRCPECRARIEAPRPDARPKVRARVDDDFPDLLPIEQEWPEEGQLFEEAGSPLYGLSSPPLHWDLDPPPLKPVVETTETYSLAPGHAPCDTQPDTPARQPAMKTAHEPYTVLPVAPNPPRPIEPDPDMLTAPPEGVKRRRIEEKLPTPPTHPFIERLWTFAFWPGNLPILAWLCVDFVILAILVTTVSACLQAGGALAGLMVLVGPLTVLFFFWIGTFAANWFFAALEETSGGADDIHWPSSGNLAEGMLKLFYLLWVAATAGVVVALPWLLFLNAVGGNVAWVAVAGLGWLLLFPVFLFCSMAAPSRFLVLEPRTLAAFLKRPHVILILFVASTLLLGLPLGLLCLACVLPSFLAGLGAGLSGAVGFLVYARLLGRVGYVLMDNAARQSTRRKRDADRSEDNDEDDESEED